MPVNFNIKNKIKINGKEYASPEEMPPDVRQIYERAMTNRQASTQVNASTKVVFNGQTYSNPDEMPDDIRGLYNAAMGVIDKDRDGIQDALQQGGSGASSSSFPTTAPSSQPRVIEPDKPNKTLWIVVITVGILALLVLTVLLTQLAR